MTALPMLVGVVLLAVLALLLLELLIEREDVAAALVLGLVVAKAALTGNVPSLTVSGIRITPADLGYGLLAAAAFARYLRLRRFTLPQRALAFLALLLLVNLWVGAMASGPSSFNDFRSYLDFVAAAVYFSTMATDATARERVGRIWFWAGWAIAFVIAVRWIGRFGGVPLGVLEARYDAAIRVLSGPETFMVAHIAIITLLVGQGRGRRWIWERRLGILMLLMAVVLNRRTVWLTLAVVLLALLVRHPAIGRRMAAVAVVGIVAFTFAVPYLPGSSGEDRPAAQTATSTGTFLWRVEGWAALLESGPDGPVELAMGQPFGRGYTREVSGRQLESTPHSYYIQTFLRGGLLGVGALLVAVWCGFVATMRREHSDGALLSRDAVLLLLLSQAVWFLTWAPGAEQGIVLGIAVAYARDDALRTRRSVREGAPVEVTGHV